MGTGLGLVRVGASQWVHNLALRDPRWQIPKVRGPMLGCCESVRGDVLGMGFGLRAPIRMSLVSDGVCLVTM